MYIEREVRGKDTDCFFEDDNLFCLEIDHTATRTFDNHHPSLQGFIPKGQRSAVDKTATRIDTQGGGERHH